ncbi:MAG: hypothetical protein K0R93_1073 [Anaerosolibacter sp.]|jgi:hypothetical protein|uniref:hypothetical protein n=1 Tax=Anaerosolibacter sp. TaxID=1872527 RepID=UPI0026035502|nr:hypothetical protein [Anaerosolibacter sp.]MDF2546175.1 hypothetical protein [Anaerosolibacter sp.]
MEILRIMLIITALANLILAYLAAIDKIKPTKSTQILYYIIAALSLLGLAFMISLI